MAEAFDKDDAAYSMDGKPGLTSPYMSEYMKRPNAKKALEDVIKELQWRIDYRFHAVYTHRPQSGRR